MGRQINFYLHPDDQHDFDTMLKSRGDIVVVPYHHYSDKVSTVPDTIVKDITKEGSRVYLLRPEDFKELRLKYFEKRNLWFIDELDLQLRGQRMYLDDIAAQKLIYQYFKA
jgi:hypothetical protein